MLRELRAKKARFREQFFFFPKNSEKKNGWTRLTGLIFVGRAQHCCIAVIGRKQQFGGGGQMQGQNVLQPRR
jgi:hypothetical protein